MNCIYTFTHIDHGCIIIYIHIYSPNECYNYDFTQTFITGWIILELTIDIYIIITLPISFYKLYELTLLYIARHVHKVKILYTF